MSFLTDEERLELLMSAMTALGKLYQDFAHAPALTLAHKSEVKKRRQTLSPKSTNNMTGYGYCRQRKRR